MYLKWLEPLRDTGEVFVETARYLALWMSYEDAIRVADLKIRRSRFERVRKEARVGADQLLQINEFLHPRVQEIADILPAPLGRWLLKTGWARGIVEKFTKDGRVLQTTSIVGFLQLYVLASLRRWRPKSLRFQFEQKKIATWLARVTSLAKEDPALALEVAECASLIKGYGDTHALGTRNFDAIMSALPLTAHEVRRLREAALADDTGRKLTEALREVNA
jgi:indolepyruvate ferredoxin oxidoreductase beta subunit